MDKESVYMCVCVCVCVYTHKRKYYSSIINNEIMLFATTWMDLEIFILSKANQKDKCHISLIRVI